MVKFCGYCGKKIDVKNKNYNESYSDFCNEACWDNQMLCEAEERAGVGGKGFSVLMYEPQKKSKTKKFKEK